MKSQRIMKVAHRVEDYGIEGARKGDMESVIKGECARGVIEYVMGYMKMVMDMKMDMERNM